MIVALQHASANEYAGTSQSVTLPLERMASGPPSGRKRFVSERPCKGPQPRRVIGHIGLFGGLIFSGPLDLPVTGSPICGKLNDRRANQMNAHQLSANGATSVKLSISGMTSSGCADTVKRLLSRVPGVTSVEVDLDKGAAVVGGTPGVPALVAAVVAAGYEAQLG